MGKRRGSSSVKKLFAWVRKQSIKVKIFLAVTAVISSLVALKLLVKDSNHFFVASEAIHVAGIAVLIFKLATQNNCSGFFLPLFTPFFFLYNLLLLHNSINE